MAGLAKRAFLELLGRHGVSAFNYAAEELERDLGNA
jgi:predicted HTH domain antitoxin